ncbi:hypothetical protein AAHC03_023037 [Spirometra sp. Aus1]
MRDCCFLILLFYNIFIVVVRGQRNPDAASITSVHTPPFETLEVHWMNPSERNGKLSSSTAIALLDGVRAAECSGTTAASSAASCSLTGLRNFTVYEVVVEVCTGPAEVDGVRGGDCNYCTNTSSSGHQTSPGAPDAANIESVLAPPFETLEVHWMNPSERNGKLSSSTAIALLDGVRAAECSGTTAASSAASCSLTGLRNFTVYEVVVEVCTGPAEVDGVRGGDCNYCTNTSSSGHQTSPGAPDAANIESVLAPPFETLEVHWMNPSERNGKLSSSTAIALLDGVRAAECSGTTAASSAASCSLTGLRNFTVYEVVVEVCTGPAEVDGVRGGDCNYCTNTSSSGHQTSPGAPDQVNIPNVTAPAPETLDVRWDNPSDSNGKLLSSTAFARSTDGGSEVNCSGTTEVSFATMCSLTGLRNFTEYAVWVEVCTAPAKEVVEGQATGGGCTNSSVKTKVTIPTAPDPATITDVTAPAPETLDVRWDNPSDSNGKLLSSTAFARSTDGGSDFKCSGTTEASSETKCSLTGLRNFTVYEVWVEVCTAPVEDKPAGDAAVGCCTNSSSVSSRTLSGGRFPLYSVRFF